MQEQQLQRTNVRHIDNTNNNNETTT